MPNPLVPSISNSQYSMSALLDSPTRLNKVIAELAVDMLVVGAFFRPAASPVRGGGMLFDVLLNGGNFSVRDVAERAPGGEYILTMADIERDLAKPHDWGAKVEILDEHLDRFDTTVTATRIVALANTLTRKIDQLAIAAVEAALTKYSIASVPGHDWGDLVTVGPLDAITPNSERPIADIANAALLIRAEDLGIKPPNVLVLHPQQHMALQVGYGSELNDVLAAVGIQRVRASMQVANGTAYVLTASAAGVIGFERPLTTEVIHQRENRRRLVQTYAVPVFAIPTPGAIRKITGLAG